MALLKQVEPVLESAIKILTQVIDIKGLAAPVAKAAPPPPPPEPEEEEPAKAPEVQANGLPAGIDIAALLGQLQGQAAPAAPAPEPEPEQATEVASDDMASVLSSLGLVQLGTGNQVKFDPNSKNGKDKDGFDDEIFIQDDSNSTPGLDDAVIIDPLSPSLSNADQKKLNKIVKLHQQKIK